MLWLPLFLALAGAPLVIAQEEATPTVAVRDDPALGAFLVDPSGWTLYTFTNDAPNVSACAGACLNFWPPVLVESEVVAPSEAPGVLSAFARDDGSMQAAYNLAPLYYYAGDTQPGDTSGQGVGGSWFVANAGLTPAVEPPSQPPPAIQPTTAPPPTSAPVPPARPTPPTGPQPAPTSATAPTSPPPPTSPPYSPPPGPRY